MYILKGSDGSCLMTGLGQEDLEKAVRRAIYHNLEVKQFVCKEVAAVNN